MNAKQAAPCRHAGVPPVAVVEKVAALIEALASDDAFLTSKGISPAEYRSAFPMALEAMRGSQSASNAGVSAYIVLLALFIRRECYVVLALLFCFIEDSLEHVIQAAGLGDDGAADLRGLFQVLSGVD
jgi:hypothetical protein